jgi:hypothetical protein
MFDPFNPGASPFSNAFEGGGYRAFAGREDQMERQKLALERAREKKRELLENEREQGEKMAKEYKVPYQPRQDWVSSATNAASAVLDMANKQGLFKPKPKDDSIEKIFNMEPSQAIKDYTKSLNIDYSRIPADAFTKTNNPFTFNP